MGAFYETVTDSEQETKEIASELAQFLQKGDVLTLEGNLGAGKTTFAKGLAKGLHIKRSVTSPTFTIVKEYKGSLPLYHMDAYRLEHSEEDIGFDEYFYGDGVSVVEWARFILEYLPENRLEIEIEQVEPERRKISFHPIGNHFEEMIARFKEKMDTREM